MVDTSNWDPFAPTPAAPSAGSVKPAAAMAPAAGPDIYRKAADEIGLERRWLDAFMGQESSGGTNTRDSIQGARGLLQITEGRFGDAGGKNFNDPTDVAYTAVRELKRMVDRYNGNPQAVAASWHSHPSNVNADGSLKNANAADKLGKRTADYQTDIARRMGDTSNWDPFAAAPTASAAGLKVFDYSAGKPAPTGLPARNAFAVANDTIINTANSIVGLIKTIPDLVSPGSKVSASLDQFIKYGESQQSDRQKALDEQLRTELKAAGTDEFGKALTYLKHSVINDPLKLLGQSAGNVAPFALLGNVMRGAGLADATIEKVAMLISSAMSAGEVRGNIYDKIQQLDDADLQRDNPEYARMRATMSEADAKRAFGSRFVEHLPELAVAAVVGAAGGKYGIEGMAAGVGPKAGRMASGAIGFADESLQGGVEQLATNFGVRRVSPSQRLGEDVGMNMVAEGLPGGIAGVALRPGGVAPGVEDKTPPPPPPPGSIGANGRLPAESLVTGVGKATKPATPTAPPQTSDVADVPGMEPGTFPTTQPAGAAQAPATAPPAAPAPVTPAGVAPDLAGQPIDSGPKFENPPTDSAQPAQGFGVNPPPIAEPAPTVPEEAPAITGAQPTPTITGQQPPADVTGSPTPIPEEAAAAPVPPAVEAASTEPPAPASQSAIETRPGEGEQALAGQPATSGATAKVDKRTAARRAAATLDTDRDDLLTAAAKLGGIDWEQARAEWGLDPADWKKFPRPVFGMPVFRKKGGRLLDDIAEALHEAGYLEAADLHALFDAFDRHMTGSPVYTARGYENFAARQAAERQEEEEAAAQQADDGRVVSGDEADAMMDALDEDAPETGETTPEDAAIETDGAREILDHYREIYGDAVIEDIIERASMETADGTPDDYEAAVVRLIGEYIPDGDEHSGRQPAQGESGADGEANEDRTARAGEAPGEDGEAGVAESAAGPPADPPGETAEVEPPETPAPAGVSVSEPEEPAFSLTGQTTAEAKAEAAMREREEKAKRAKESAPPPEEFSLAGSIRQTDVAAGKGQQDLPDTDTSKPTEPPQEAPSVERGMALLREIHIKVDAVNDETGEAVTARLAALEVLEDNGSQLEKAKGLLACLHA